MSERSERSERVKAQVDWKFLTSVAGPALALVTAWVSMQADLKVAAKNVDELKMKVEQLSSVITKQAVTDEKLGNIERRLADISGQLQTVVQTFSDRRAAAARTR